MTLSKNEVVDLSFIFDRKLCFRSQIENMPYKALKSLELVERVCINFKPSSSVKYFYCYYSSFSLEVWYSYLGSNHYY